VVTHLRRRLARDHPVILERYERGEFKSVRAAAIKAGIVEAIRLRTEKGAAGLLEAAGW
jgi:hypothetical protein